MEDLKTVHLVFLALMLNQNLRAMEHNICNEYYKDSKSSVVSTKSSAYATTRIFKESK